MPTLIHSIKQAKSKVSRNIVMADKTHYFYTINYTVYEESLCKMEMKYLFNSVPNKKYFFSNRYVDPARSCFIKQYMPVMYTSETLDDLVKQILNDKLSFENFKVRYIDTEDNSITFDERRNTEKIIGFYINGQADIHNPKILIGITKIKDTWVLGVITENKTTWKKYNNKPFSYSNALGVRTARALVNIALENNFEKKLVDPCCGIGTVILEALSMGINIKGYEINPLIAENAKKNLEYFDYENVITQGSMHNIEAIYDCAIVDMPYGLFATTTLKDQLNIIKTVSRIAIKAIFITYEDMDEYLLNNNFEILDKCHIIKGKLKRHITITRIQNS